MLRWNAFVRLILVHGEFIIPGYLEFWQFPNPFAVAGYVCVSWLLRCRMNFPNVARVIPRINGKVLETFFFHQVPSTFVRFEDYNWSFFSVAPSCNNNEKQRPGRGSASHMHKPFGVRCSWESRLRTSRISIADSESIMVCLRDQKLKPW